MPFNWKSCRLGDFITLHRGFDLPTQDRRQGIVPVISSSGRSGTHDRAMVKGPGVVTGRYGTIGHVFYVDGDFWPLNTTLYVSDFKGNNPAFVANLLSTLDFFAHSDKSTVPGVNRNHLHTVEVRVPTDTSEQKNIADVLDAFTRKIELNRQMNETLETTARTVFRAWFMDPFVHRETGGLPAGWSVRTVGDVCRRISMGPFGSDIKTEYFVSAGVPVIRGGNLRNGFIDQGFVYISDAKADELRNANAYPDDIVITHRGTLGQIGIIPRHCRFPRYVVSQSQMVLTADPNAVNPRFIFEFFRSPCGLHALLSNTSQTGVPAIARPVTAVKAIRLTLPPLSLQARFQHIAQSLADKEVANEHENETLSALRNTLLHKLISGEIRIKQAERLIEAHA